MSTSWNDASESLSPLVLSSSLACHVSPAWLSAALMIIQLLPKVPLVSMGPRIPPWVIKAQHPATSPSNGYNGSRGWFMHIRRQTAEAIECDL